MVLFCCARSGGCPTTDVMVGKEKACLCSAAVRARWWWPASCPSFTCVLVIACPSVNHRWLSSCRAPGARSTSHQQAEAWGLWAPRPAKPPRAALLGGPVQHRAQHIAHGICWQHWVRSCLACPLPLLGILQPAEISVLRVAAACAAKGTVADGSCGQAQWQRARLPATRMAAHGAWLPAVPCECRPTAGRHGIVWVGRAGAQLPFSWPLLRVTCGGEGAT